MTLSRLTALQCIAGFVAHVAAKCDARPAAQVCKFYVETGHCRFGSNCHFDHPVEHTVPLTVDWGLPWRPTQPPCDFYMRTAACKFGPSCKFHHPPLRALYAGSGA